MSMLTAMTLHKVIIIVTAVTGIGRKHSDIKSQRNQKKSCQAKIKFNHFPEPTNTTLINTYPTGCLLSDFRIHEKK